MNIYNVEVKEELSRVVEQRANSYEEAESIVQDRYDTGDIVLEWNDLNYTSYSPYPAQKIKQDFDFWIRYDKANENAYIVDNDQEKEFKCRDIDELKYIVNDYIDNNILLEEVRAERKIIDKKQDRDSR